MSDGVIEVRVCELHGLRYNAAIQDGCARCRREGTVDPGKTSGAPAPPPAQPPTPVPAPPVAASGSLLPDLDLPDLNAPPEPPQPPQQAPAARPAAPLSAQQQPAPPSPPANSAGTGSVGKGLAIAAALILAATVGLTLLHSAAIKWVGAFVSPPAGAESEYLYDDTLPAGYDEESYEDYESYENFDDSDAGYDDGEGY